MRFNAIPLLCPKCLGPLEDPKSLGGCLHSLCRHCAEDHLCQGGNTTYPICNAPLLITSPDEISHLPTHFFLRTEETQEKKKAVFCLFCEDEPAVLGCEMCGQCYCKTHAKAYQKTKATAGHPLTAPERVATKQEELCWRHTGQPLNCYCVECDIALCGECGKYQPHNKHTIVGLGSVADQYFTEAQQLVNTLHTHKTACTLQQRPSPRHWPMWRDRSPPPGVG